MSKSARVRRKKTARQERETREDEEQLARAKSGKKFPLGLLVGAGIIVLGGAITLNWLRVVQPSAAQTSTLQATTPATTPAVSTQGNATPVENTLVPPQAAPISIPEILVDTNRKMNPKAFSFLNARRAKMIRAELDDKTRTIDLTERRNLEVIYAKELLNAGKSNEALRAYRANMNELKSNAPDLFQSIESGGLQFEAICNLRMGEQLNCCARNNQNSCLVPISGAGVHTKQEGSRAAVKCLTECLTLNADDTSSRWLLNIAYMTLGEYPDKVPAQWLIPLNTYGGDYPMAKFTNAAPDIGLDLEGWAGSVIMEDFEGSGLLDLVISSWNMDGQMRYIHNNGDGTFTERTKESGLLGEIGGLNMITTDYNNDGRPDIVVLRGGWYGKNGFYPLSLLRNDGGGHFTDVTIQAGLLTKGPTQTAVAFDYNGDGFLDLFIGYETAPGVAVSCKLYRNNGDGTFADVTAQCGLYISMFVKGVVSADYTHSGRPGLYISCLDGPNIMLRNDGPAGPDKSLSAPWKFTNVSSQAGVSVQKSTFSCFFFDYDNDGWPDLYVGGYGGNRSLAQIANDYLGLPTTAQKAKLYRNNHDGTFTDVSKQAHLDKVNLGMGINFGDLDNDGWLDFYVGTGSPELEMLLPNRMFRNHDGQYFDEVTTTGGFGHLQKGHGIAFGDIDNSGQQHVFLVAGGALEGDTAHDCLFVNPGNSNHWITLKLAGVKSNRIALGAEICVTVTTPGGERRIYKTVNTGGSFGNNPLRQEIGLGNATGIKQVSIHWPASGIDQIITGLSIDCVYKIREGESGAERWNVPTFKLKTAPADQAPTLPATAPK